MAEEEGIEPVWHRSSTDYRAYKAPPRPALSSVMVPRLRIELSPTAL
jgi:hypothetical protein